MIEIPHLRNEDARKLLTVRDVARLLSISERSVWRASASGDLPKPVQIRGSSRWLQDEIEAALDRAAARRQ